MAGERDALSTGLDALGIQAPDGALGRLITYLDLLEKWNSAYNLTALRDRRDWIRHHLLDSLSVSAWVRGPSVWDVGTGPGLPGIPLAVCHPHWHVHMIDSSQKKAAFVTQALGELGLSNAHMHRGRAEEAEATEPANTIVSRAFSDLAQFVTVTRHLLAPGGRWLAMKGTVPEEEIRALGPELEVAGIHALQVPGLDAKRHAILLQPSAVKESSP